MKTYALFAFLSVISMRSNAEVFVCTFTEPFIGFTYNTGAETLLEFDYVSQKSKFSTNVDFQINQAGAFLLKDKSGAVVAELLLNNKGSDGMSDAVYPYEVKYLGMDGSYAAHGLSGGCSSSLRPKFTAAQ